MCDQPHSINSNPRVVCMETGSYSPVIQVQAFLLSAQCFAMIISFFCFATLPCSDYSLIQLTGWWPYNNTQFTPLLGSKNPNLGFFAIVRHVSGGRGLLQFNSISIMQETSVPCTLIFFNVLTSIVEEWLSLRYSHEIYEMTEHLESP